MLLAVMLGLAFCIVMLSVIMLSVVMLSVVVPGGLLTSKWYQGYAVMKLWSYETTIGMGFFTLLAIKGSKLVCLSVTDTSIA